MPVAAIDQLCGDGIGTIGMIGSTAGIAETGFATERDIVKMIAVMTVVKTIALFQIATIKHFLDFVQDNRANTWSGGKERGPMILKYLLYGELSTHKISP